MAYIAATPTTPANRVYMQRQYDSMAKGMPPDDFADYGVDESKLTGFKGFLGEENVFKKVMGY